MILINTTETIQIYKMEKKTIKKKKNATRNYIKKIFLFSDGSYYK